MRPMIGEGNSPKKFNDKFKTEQDLIDYYEMKAVDAYHPVTDDSPNQTSKSPRETLRARSVSQDSIARNIQ